MIIFAAKISLNIHYMKQKRIVFLLFFSLILVNRLPAQFYTVKKKKDAVRVYSSGEISDDKVFNHMTESIRKNPLSDTLSSRHSSALEELMKNRLLFSSPLENDTLIVTSHYGHRPDPFSGKLKFHTGTDYLTFSENVYAMMPGRIKSVGYKRKLGNYIEIEHGDFTVLYGHLYTVIGRKGDSLDAGQSVGISGSTGRSTGEHLHIEVKYKGKRMNPHPFVLYICNYVKYLRNAISVSGTDSGKP